jgi:hypothetical protein
MTEGTTPQQNTGNTSNCCSGKGKYLVGILIGLLIAGSGFGMFMLGKCSTGNSCPMTGADCAMKDGK